jgi:hypothetical protein
MFAYFVIQLKDGWRNLANFFRIHPHKRVKHVKDEWLVKLGKKFHQVSPSRKVRWYHPKRPK